MSTVVIDKKEEIVMRLVHYFITEKNYSPIIVNGVKNEVWLENIDGPYRIIRINTNYIHNDEQIKYDITKTKNIISQIKRKTFSFRVNTLNIFLDLNEGVKTLEDKNILSVSLDNLADIDKNSLIKEAFPDISSNLLNDTKGIDLIINVTNDINEKTAKDNKTYEKVFKPKKVIITNILIVICVLLGIYGYYNPTLMYSFGNSFLGFKLHQYYRLITAVFLHDNSFIISLHLLFNMYALYVLGNQVETFLGKWKFLTIFLISGVVGSLFSITFNTNVLGIGASGAIFGLMGALIYFGYHYRLYLNVVVKSQIIPLVLVNLALGFMSPGIDNFAHIGGLIGGYLATMALGASDKATKQEMINGWIVLLLLIAFLFGFNIYR